MFDEHKRQFSSESRSTQSWWEQERDITDVFEYTLYTPLFR